MDSVYAISALVTAPTPGNSDAFRSASRALSQAPGEAPADQPLVKPGALGTIAIRYLDMVFRQIATMDDHKFDRTV